MEFHIKEMVISAKQKSQFEKKLLKLKRYIKDEPLLIDCYFKDESSPEKGGVNQVVELSATFGHEKIFMREIDERLVRAFANAYKNLERKLTEFHKERIDRTRGSESKFDQVLKRLGIRK